MKYGYEQINYTNFENDLYDARFELAASRIMDTDLETIEETVVAECDKVAVNGKCHLSKLRWILTNHKSICLTPFQLALLCGFADTDVDTGMFDYKSFAANLSGWITEIFSIDALRRKSQLVQLGHSTQKKSICQNITKINCSQFSESVTVTRITSSNGKSTNNAYCSCKNLILPARNASLSTCSQMSMGTDRLTTKNSWSTLTTSTAFLRSK